MSAALQVRRKDFRVHCGAADAIMEREDAGAGAGAAREGMAARALRRMVGSCMVGNKDRWSRIVGCFEVRLCVDEIILVDGDGLSREDDRDYIWLTPSRLSYYLVVIYHVVCAEIRLVL